MLYIRNKTTKLKLTVLNGKFRIKKVKKCGGGREWEGAGVGRVCGCPLGGVSGEMGMKEVWERRRAGCRAGRGVGKGRERLCVLEKEGESVRQTEKTVCAAPFVLGH